MNDYKAATGARMCQLRKIQGKSQAEVAKYLELTVAAYQNYEAGRREAGYEVLSKLADFYGVTTDYLLGREPAPDPLAILNIQVNNKKFVDIYQELPEFQQRFLVDAMVKLSAAAEANVPTKSREQKQPRTSMETTLGAVEDDVLAPEEDAGA